MFKSSAYSIKPSPSISIPQVTVSLAITPERLMTSSMKDCATQNAFLSSFPQATPSTSNVIFTSMLSSDEKKKKKLKEGRAFFKLKFYAILLKLKWFCSDCNNVVTGYLLCADIEFANNFNSSNVNINDRKTIEVKNFVTHKTYFTFITPLLLQYRT